MGGGSYNTASYSTRSTMRASKSVNDVFTQNVARKTNEGMIPWGVMRESRDSVENPESLAIMVFLDETGSMGNIPVQLCRGALTHMMSPILEKGITQAQICFAGIGDHEADREFLQVGQFETSDELIDTWLTNLYLEGNGGGNGGESYLLAWLFAARNTSIDCYEKRGQKGFLFTIGDEPTLNNVPADIVKKLSPTKEGSSVTALELLTEAKEKYNVFHIHINHGGRGCGNLKEIMGDNLIVVSDYNEIPKVMGEIVSSNYTPGKVTTLVEGSIQLDPPQDEEPKEIVDML